MIKTGVSFHGQVAQAVERIGELQAASDRPFTVDAMNGYQSLDEYPQDVRLLGTASRG